MKTIVKNFSKIKKEAGNIAKSAWEKEFEKGIEKGIKQNAIKMLKLNLEVDFIQ